MPKSTPRHTLAYSLRLDPETRNRLHSKSEAAGVPLSEALRIGGEQYLDGLLASGATAQALSAEPTPAADDPLLAEFRAVAAKIERRMSGS